MQLEVRTLRGGNPPVATAQKRGPRELGLTPLRRGCDLAPIGTSERGCDGAGLGNVEAGTCYYCRYCLGTIVGVTLPARKPAVQQAEMKRVVRSFSPSITEYGEWTGARS